MARRVVDDAVMMTDDLKGGRCTGFLKYICNGGGLCADCGLEVCDSALVGEAHTLSYHNGRSRRQATQTVMDRTNTETICGGNMYCLEILTVGGPRCWWNRVR